ncbi:hypothetical protein DFH11DRAFT_1665614 [Phellopilus nigrolimitatus]|nr:hypothetical protein DFH11DRAFT_1665614 [Phellopilus nigrolimitatus]
MYSDKMILTIKIRAASNKVYVICELLFLLFTRTCALSHFDSYQLCDVFPYVLLSLRTVLFGSDKKDRPLCKHTT